MSLEQVLRVRTRTELVGRYAYKLDGDSYYAAHSSLLGLRLDQKIGARFDVGAEARQASIRGIDGTSATAFALEGGVRLGDNTRVGAGLQPARQRGSVARDGPDEARLLHDGDERRRPSVRVGQTVIRRLSATLLALAMTATLVVAVREPARAAALCATPGRDGSPGALDRHRQHVLARHRERERGRDVDHGRRARDRRRGHRDRVGRSAARRADARRDDQHHQHAAATATAAAAAPARSRRRPARSSTSSPPARSRSAAAPSRSRARTAAASSTRTRPAATRTSK